MPEKNPDSRRLIIFFGMIAAGKSFLAKEWAYRNQCPYHNSDVIRKELAGCSQNSRQTFAINRGIYSPEYTKKTYDELINRAEKGLQSTVSGCAVLDGSYKNSSDRQSIVSSFSSKATVFFIYCSCSEATIRKRLRSRAADPQSISDGRWEIYQQQKGSFQIPTKIDGAHLLHIYTEKHIDELIKEVDSFIGKKISY
ncbi:MAG: AAA family ATPase [Deltaproteobacteria bacterium]|nr:AAA family ATPase [Deltaproteobacteria bacterium]